MKKSVLACTLAAAILRLDPINTRRMAMTLAWEIVNKYSDLAVLEFNKVDGTFCRRVVSADWSKYQAPKGTGKPVKDGLCLFADIAKYLLAKPCIISTYKQNIVRLAA